MFVSKLFAKNYRSLRQTKIEFKQGKNILVGKNNAGKSNIIHALDILLGSKFPIYQNFTDNDFFTYENVNIDTGEVTEIVADDFYIEVTLEGRDFDEELIKSIKKKTAFSQLNSIRSLYEKNDKGEIEINYNLLQNLDEIENNKEIAILKIKNGYDIKTDWKDCNELLDFLKSNKCLKMFITINRKDEELKGFGLIVKDDLDKYWISHFLTQKLRNSLITTAVINSFRSPKEDLRIVHYTWFGKYIKHIWDNGKVKIANEEDKTYEDLIQSVSKELKGIVNTVFNVNTSELRELLQKAISHKSVSFKFLEDTKSELYKNIRIYVDDGIDRPLTEKGTGIQSAIIIAFFSQYCELFHHTSSLLIAEEPEIFLHPHARRVLSAELNKYLNRTVAQERQLIISTHSTEFLKNVEPDNIIRIHNSKSPKETEIAQLSKETALLLNNNIKRLIWSQNAEIFFADKVVLVEGGEVYLLPEIIDKIKESKQIVDYKDITIARVNGKGNFTTYIKMLNEYNIKWFILADLDSYKFDIAEIARLLNLNDIMSDIIEIQTVFKNIETDYGKIKERIKKINKNTDAQTLKVLFEKFLTNTIKADDEELIAVITEMQERYKEKDYRTAIIESGLLDKFDKLQECLRDSHIFVWSFGELESYYSETSMQISGSKDIKALELSYLLSNEKTKIDDYFKHKEELELLVTKIID